VSAVVPKLELNGQPAAADDLRLLVANNYGHFTALRVIDGAARGLDLHLERLERGTRELFGSMLDRERVRAWLRQAVGAARGELSVRINVFSRAFDRARPGAAAQPDVLISVAAAPQTREAKAVRLKTFVYCRELPHLKHVGTFPLFHFRAAAQRAGFDDALFVDSGGAISEASIWNIGFFDDSGIVWPQAPQLDGVGMRLLQAGASKLGVSSAARPVRLGEVATFRAAFLTNAARVAQPVASIDGVAFANSPELFALLEHCYSSNPAQAL